MMSQAEWRVTSSTYYQRELLARLEESIEADRRAGPQFRFAFDGGLTMTRILPQIAAQMVVEDLMRDELVKRLCEILRQRAQNLTL